MKKKILSIALVVAMIAIIAAGSFAYFTDKDAETNTFTVGNVKIDLQETFEPDSVLVPGTNKINTVEKVVDVQNTGKTDAYVRVHLAIPAALVDQDINAYNDMLHTNFAAASAADGKWSWHPTMTNGEGWTDNGRANNNTYNTKIDGVEYTVWVITYRTALAPNEKAEGAISQVYLDKYVNAIQNDDGTITYTKPFFTDRQGGTVDESKTMNYTIAADGKIPVYVVAEGCQVDGFADAYEALNTSFGTPGSYTITWHN